MWLGLVKSLVASAKYIYLGKKQDSLINTIKIVSLRVQIALRRQHFNLKDLQHLFHQPV